MDNDSPIALLTYKCILIRLIVLKCKKGDVMQIQQCHNPVEIIHVIHAAFQRYQSDAVPSSALKETAISIKKELDEGIMVFGVSKQDTVIAVVKCKLETDAFYFSRLSVLPIEQGKGIATQLVHFIEHYATTHDFKRVTCKVRASEDGNIRLYTKLGYSIIAEEIDVLVPNVTMEKTMI